MNEKPALVTNIQGYSIHDGPGIRTVVFLKGCGLECRWCSNPECISPQPEIGFYKSLCARCGKCSSVCPNQALSYDENHLPRIDRKLCSGCGTCTLKCDYRALVLFGSPMSPEEVFKAVERDKMFYDGSGGGVTVSGGECLLHPGFVGALLDKSRRAGIHTCIETSGHASEAAFRQVLQYTDYILFDLKHQNPDIHRQYTGRPNNLILNNARIAAAGGVTVLFRMPLISGINDDEQNINETAAFLAGLELKDPGIELMPYHRLGKGKYEALNRQYDLPDLLSPEQDCLERVKKAFESLDIACSISS